MERCDFCSVMNIIRTYISEDQEMNQIDFLYLLFDDFVSSDEAMDFDFDPGEVCRWLKGIVKISPRISKHYLDEKNRRKLSTNICRHFIPIMFDSSMVTQKIYELILYDNDISNQKKQELLKKYPCKNASDEADFITESLCFAMSRNFIKRDKKTQQLLTAGTLSPIIYDTIMSNDTPKPCRHFCGRDNELRELHELLIKDKKVFLHGIAGIGKSELAKAYAKKYKLEYTNILFLSYSGDLVKDITELDFVDDLPEDTEQERFRKHNRFLRSLKEDTLLVIDNFNTTATQESFLSTILKYRCRIIFTTRSRFDNYTTLELKEISDRSVLIDLIGKFYSDAKNHPIILDEIVELVHHHTLAVELIARLLENGILDPFSLLKKLEKEKAAFDAADKIGITKDGNQKTAILIRLGCDKESDFRIAENNLKKMNETVEKLSERQKTLEQQKSDETTKFHEWNSKVSPEKELELLDERISLRENHRNSLIGKLQEVFGRVFSYERLRDASDEIDYYLNEDPDIIRKRTWEKRYEQAQEKAQNQTQTVKKPSRGIKR